MSFRETHRDSARIKGGNMFKKFPTKYYGSAINFIEEFIIPSLPEVENVISFNDSLLLYLETGGVNYVRKFGEFSSRGRVYSEGKTEFTVTDNEPALWAYMQSFEQNKNPFSYYEQNKIFPIAFAITQNEKKYFDSRFNYGKQKRETNFSKLGLKHCHILDCSPRGFGLEELTLNQRMMRLMSPMNHFPFPSPKKYSMKDGDIGEDPKFQSLIISILSDQFYKSSEERSSFNDFIINAGGKLPNGRNDDFMIEYVPKQDAELVFKKEKSFIGKSIEKTESSQNYAITYFKLDKRWYGQKRVVQVKFKKGIHQKPLYVYDHDFVYDNTIKRLNTMSCWEKDGCYSSSNNIPEWAKSFVQKVDN